MPLHHVTKNTDASAEPDLNKASPRWIAALQLGCGAVIKGEAHSKVTLAVRQYQAFIPQSDFDTVRWGLERAGCGVLDLRGGRRFNRSLVALGHGRIGQ